MDSGERRPLAGVRVIDSADERGELCGRILADLGADVLRLEPPGGSHSRSLPPLAADGTSLFFAVRNVNKRSATVNLADAIGRDELDRLLAGADVWIDGHAPRELEALGIDLGYLLERHPRLVVTSITDFGLTGPYRDYVATDDVLIAMSGMLCRSGVPGEPPLLPPGSLAHDVASTTAAFGTLAALWQRRRTGRGQHLDLSVQQAVAQVADWALPNWAAVTSAGGVYGQIRSGSGAVYPIYPCADGYVRLVVLNPRQWRAMRAWLGEPEELQDDHWDVYVNRMVIQLDVLDPLYRTLFADRSAADLADEAQRRGIVMTPLLRPSEVLAAPHFAERGTFVRAEAAPGVQGAIASGFFELDGERAGYRHRAPMVGEHTAEVAVAQDRAASAPPPSGDPAPGLPFSGLKVLDFGHGGVGVETGRLLAEYGADVVKVESRSYPDFMRVLSGGEMTASFASSSRDKRSFGVAIREERGVELVLRLVAWADVVIENNSTGTMEKMGLGYEALRAVNPGIVMMSSQLMGSRGRWSSWIGYGPSTRPVSGMSHLWNFPRGGMPPGSGAIHPDHLVGRMGAVGALAALLGREDAGGAGMHVEVAQVETVIGLLADLFLKESLEPGTVGPEGNARGRGAPWGVYQCRGEERWCAITVRSDEDWRRLRSALGDPAWAVQPHLETTAGRLAEREALDQGLGAWCSSRTDREVMELLQAAGVPAGMMCYAADLASDPHLLARGYPEPLDQPGFGHTVLEGRAFDATGMSAPIIAPAPGMGQHTREIAREVLGMSDDEVDALVASDVLEE